jgi:CspA family cold shock protein
VSNGTIKWFNPQNRYGFIQPANGGAEIFVHLSSVVTAGLGELRPGQHVSFDIVTYWKTGKEAATNLKAIA